MRGALVTVLMIGLPMSVVVIFFTWDGLRLHSLSLVDAAVGALALGLLAAVLAWMGFVVSSDYGIRITEEYILVVGRRFTGGTVTSRVVPLKDVRIPKVLTPKISHNVGFQSEDGSISLVLSYGLARALIRSPYYRGSKDVPESILNFS